MTTLNAQTSNSHAPLPFLCVSGLNFDFDIRVRFLALAKFCGRVIRLSFDLSPSSALSLTSTLHSTVVAVVAVTLLQSYDNWDPLTGWGLKWLSPSIKKRESERGVWEWGLEGMGRGDIDLVTRELIIQSPANMCCPRLVPPSLSTPLLSLTQSRLPTFYE